MIEIRNFKMLPALSEETMCYAAHVSVNGMAPSILASNAGHGGPDNYEPISRTEGGIQAYERDMEELREKVKTLPPRDLKISASRTIKVKMTLDIFIGDEVDKFLRFKGNEKDAKILAKKLKTHTVFAKDRKVLMMKAPFNKDVKDYFDKEDPTATILNELPFDEALKIWLNRV